MASKQNDDLFNQASKQNEGSLPLDFAGGAGNEAEPKKETEHNPKVKNSVAETVRKEMAQNSPSPIPHTTQYSPDNDIGRSDLNGLPRKPMHHVPPPYKKSVQEQAQTQEVKETKNETPVSTPPVPVQTPVQEKTLEVPKAQEVVPQELKNTTPVLKTEPVNLSEPKPVQSPKVTAPSLAYVSPAASPTPVKAVETMIKKENLEEKKEPVKLQPKVKEPKEVKKPEHKVEHKSEKSPSSHHHNKKESSPVQQAPAATPVQPKVNEAKPVKQDEKNNIHKSKKFNIIEKFSSDNATSGQILQEGRVRLGMSIDQISIITKIKKNFIEALERDDYQNLPAPVYVNAYVRSLCYLYKIDEHHVLSLLNKVKGKSLEYTVPEEVIHHIEKGKQINIIQEVKIKRITLMMIAACLILAAGTVVIYQLLIMNKAQTSSLPAPVKIEKIPDVNPNPVKAPVLNSASIQDQMEKNLISPHVFTMSQLPLPEQR